MVRSYELGVLLVPRLEAAYRASRWRGFSCTSPAPQLQHPLPPLKEAPSLSFVQWERGQSQDPPPGAVAADASGSGGGGMRVPLPLPYALPPHPYASGEDRPWAVDVGARVGGCSAGGELRRRR